MRLPPLTSFAHTLTVWMRPALSRRKPLAVSILALGMTMGAAQGLDLALVDEDYGHAVLFAHRGNCFALLPSHVARGDRFTLEQPVRGADGSATTFLRDAERDLAIATVAGDITSGCTDLWTDFPSDLDGLLEDPSRAQIVRLGPEGYQDRTDAVVIEHDPDRILVQTTDEMAPGDVQQGTSGAALEIDGIFVGIAQEAQGTRRAWFFRTDRIRRLSAPYLISAPRPSIPQDRREDGGLGFVVTAWSGTGSGADDATRLEPGLIGAPYVAEWTGKPLTIEVTLDPERPVPVLRLRLGSGPRMPDGQTPPRGIALEADVGPPGAPYWRSLGVRDMSPTVGRLDFTTGGTVARRIRITIQSVWAPEAAVRIDGLVIE